MALYPRFSAGDFFPLFRLLDYDIYRSTRSSPSHRRHNHDHWLTARSFAPRFDVREVNDSYLLDGELPGVQQKDVEIEFTDPHTLVIKGRVEHEYTSNNDNDNDNEQDETTANDSSSDDDASSKKSYQPTVEDADEDETTGTNHKSTTVIPTPDTSSTSTSTSSDNRLSKSTKNKGKGKAVQKQQPSFKYWVSERSVGEFQRTFTFPTRVNQDAVKASLKNGILSIVVPKEPAHVVKKIRIE